MPKSKLPKYLKPKRKSFYYQRRVPADAAHAPPFSTMPPVYERALNTKDMNTALRRLAETNEWFDRHLVAVRAGTVLADDPAPHVATAGKKPRVRDARWASFYAGEEYLRLVSGYRQRRQAVNSGVVGAAEQLDDWFYHDWGDLNSSIESIRDRDPRAVRRLALAILSGEGEVTLEQDTKPSSWFRRYPIEKTEAFGLLCGALLDARWDAYNAIRNEFDGGIETYLPKSSSVKNAPRDLDEDDQFALQTIANRVLDASSGTTKSWETRLKLLPEICRQFGLPTDVRLLTKAHIGDLMEKLAKCPANKTQRFPGLSWPEAIEANKVAKEPTLSPNSLKNAYLAPLMRILGYAEEQELIVRNPARGIAVKGASRKKRGTHFEVDELNKMLKLPLFTGCKSKDAINETGDVLIDDHWFWAPLVALFTGARTSEIAQLKVHEVEFSGPAPYLRIQSDAERSLKSDAANRTVPIHPILLKIGFKEYVERTKAAGSDRLFPCWEKPSGDKGFADAPSQRHFRRNVVPLISSQTSPRPTFHSFRHTVKNAMGACGLPQQHQNEILGHEQAGMDSVYLGKLPVSVLAKSMERLTYPGLEIDHLFGTRKRPKTNTTRLARA